MREKEAGDGPGKAKNRLDGVLNFKIRKLGEKNSARAKGGRPQVGEYFSSLLAGWLH